MLTTGVDVALVVVEVGVVDGAGDEVLFSHSFCGPPKLLPIIRASLLMLR